ncbi:phosphodiester glycosidase family protein [Pseudoblastomonas halimionae]|uniref:phosphodiester glycosidase family protein n=1 Tax=Alteriqipengyuania halimionae TaxID=1926630 RepID=UPI002D7F7710|nr:phosphodiester glycosidase family protein [Alteriqipengyuania halimionae]
MRVALPLVLLLALGACDRQQPGEPVSRSEIGGKALDTPSPAPSASEKPTPQRASACEAVEFEGVQLTHCVADPAKHRIRTALSPKDGAPYRSFAALAKALGSETSRVAFAMNGGMFDGEGKPIGYYVQNGERLHELNTAEGDGNFHMLPNGVFFGTGAKWRVMATPQFYATVGDRPKFGTQSGPMLVIDGKLHPEIQDDGPSIRIRNGVGVDAKGRAHFVISEMPLSFGKFARYFRDELKTPNALYLDGSVSALWDPAANRRDSGASIGPILLVEDKE